MSDARALEAVTETLRGLVDAGVKHVAAGAFAVAQPPHEVTTTGQSLQVNLFLYHTEIDGALRNTDPVGLQPGETGEPALPLILHYLLTPYAPDGDDIRAHRLLGGALQALHSHSRLTRTDLAAVASYSDVSKQVEQVNITWQPFEEKDIYSLWSVFQAPYRLSVAFEVRVVLIDSRRTAITPLPVLTRGADGRGPVAAPEVGSPVPALTVVRFPTGQPAARVGDDVDLGGAHLSGTSAVLIDHPTLSAPDRVTPGSVAADTVTFKVPATVPAGLCTVSLVLGVPPQESVVGELYLPVGPKVTSPMPMTVARDGNGTAVVTLTCTPAFQPGQRITLVVGDRQVPADAITTTTATLSFQVTDAAQGTHRIRLRCDGVDSLIVADRSAFPPVFDQTQRLTVT
jgi:hypothetical protein